MPQSFSGITTVMPVFAAELDQVFVEALTRAAMSVLNQNCRIPLELLVVDDGSTVPVAHVPQFASVFERKDVTHVRLSRNEGIAFALNVGLQRARYDLIARIDADDYWRPGKLQKQLEAFEADPDLTIVGTGMRCVHRDPRLDTDHVRGPLWKDSLKFAIEKGCPFPHGSILARKDIFLLMGGYPHDPRFSFCEDFALWSSWMRFFKCALLPEVLFEYAVSATQSSSRNAKRQLDASDQIRQSLRGLPNIEHTPDLLAEMAEFLHLPLLETSKLLFTAWRYYDLIVAVPKVHDRIRKLLPDRRVCGTGDLPDPGADRFFRIPPKGN